MRWIEVKTDGTVNGNSDVADTAQHSETNFVTESYAEWKDRSLKLSCCEVGKHSHKQPVIRLRDQQSLKYSAVENYYTLQQFATLCSTTSL